MATATVPQVGPVEFVPVVNLQTVASTEVVAHIADMADRADAAVLGRNVIGGVVIRQTVEIPIQHVPVVEPHRARDGAKWMTSPTGTVFGRPGDRGGRQECAGVVVRKKASILHAAGAVDL